MKRSIYESYTYPYKNDSYPSIICTLINDYRAHFRSMLNNVLDRTRIAYFSLMENGVHIVFITVMVHNTREYDELS